MTQSIMLVTLYVIASLDVSMRYTMTEAMCNAKSTWTTRMNPILFGALNLIAS